MSVAQADEVIIALHGDKSKMSIYDKNPSGEGFDFSWSLCVLRGIQVPVNKPDRSIPVMNIRRNISALHLKSALKISYLPMRLSGR